MSEPDEVGMTQADKFSRHIVWLLAGLILLSFVFGVVMFLPAEHRAQKLQEVQQKFQAKQHTMPASSVNARAHTP